MRQNFSTHSLPPVSNMVVNYRRCNSNVKQIPPNLLFSSRNNCSNIVNTNLTNDRNKGGELPKNLAQRFISSSNCFNGNINTFEPGNSLLQQNHHSYMINAQSCNIPLSDSDKKLNFEINEDEEEEDNQTNSRWALV